MQESVIVSAVRTPTGKVLGSLKELTAPELGALVVRLGEDRGVHHHRRVSREHEASGRGGEHGVRLRLGHAAHVRLGGFAGVNRFVGISRPNVEGEAGRTQELGAPRRRRREKKRHNVTR